RRVVAVQPTPGLPVVVADATDVPGVAVGLGRSEDSARGGDAQSARGGDGQSAGNGRGPTTNAVVANGGHSTQSNDRSSQSTEKSVIQKNDDEAAPAMVARDLQDDGGDIAGRSV